MKKFIILLYVLFAGFSCICNAEVNEDIIKDLKNRKVCVDGYCEYKADLSYTGELNANKYYDILLKYCNDLRDHYYEILGKVKCDGNVEDLVKIIYSSLESLASIKYSDNIEKFKENTIDIRRNFNEAQYYVQYVEIYKQILESIKKNPSVWENCNIKEDYSNFQDVAEIKEYILKCLEIGDDIDSDLEKCGDYFENTSGWLLGDYTIKLTDKGKKNLFLQKMLGELDSYHNVAVTERCGIVNRPYRGYDFGPIITIKTAWGEKRSYNDNYLEEVKKGIDFSVPKKFDYNKLKYYKFKTGKEFMDWVVGCFDKLALSWLSRYRSKLNFYERCISGCWY